MKHLRTKLLSAIAMLVIAAVMMTGATFAWFTISANPEISNITGNVTANGNLELALDAGQQKTPAASKIGDAGKNETWGNLVDLTKFFNTAAEKDTVMFKPVQIGSGSQLIESNQLILSKPVYGLDGRVDSLAKLKRINAQDSTLGEDFKDFGGIWLYTDSSATSQPASAYDAAIYAVEIDYWLRTNVSGSNISLTTAVSRAEDATDVNAGQVGSGSWITDNRVAPSSGYKQQLTILFADCGEQQTVDTAGEPVTMTSPTWYIAKYSDAVDGYCALTLASLTLNADGTYTIGANASIPLTEDKAKLIKMYILMDGMELHNDDALEAFKNITMNIQFTSDKTLEAMDVEMDDHGRFQDNSQTEKVDGNDGTN